jgi:hypothetical protein
MPYQCRMIDIQEVGHKNVQVGDMWYADWYITNGKPLFNLTDDYVRDWMNKRPPIVVRLPGGVSFLVDSKCCRDGVFEDHGWKVTGEPPNITVSPSINIIGIYHGWLQNGVINDDVEGRIF